MKPGNQLRGYLTYALVLIPAVTINWQMRIDFCKCILNAGVYSPAFFII